MKTSVTKKADIIRKWYIIDADGATLGRVATIIADLLRGKKKACFSPAVDCGDYVIVINSSKIAVTGNKLIDKKYYRHSGYPGGLTELSLEQLLVKDSNKVIFQAVKGMLPKNKLADEVIGKLKIFKNSEHGHTAQKPIEIKVK